MLPGLRQTTPVQGTPRRDISDSVWKCGIEEPTAASLPLPAARGEDLQPATGFTARARQSRIVYLEVKWSSLLAYAPGCDLLHDVLPVNEKLNAETMRQHLFQVAERMEGELGNEHPCRMEGGEEDGEQLPIPDGPLTVGLEGGFVRARHKRGCFEVIVGKSILEFKRDAEGEEKSQKCLGFVQTYDDKPRRRLFELLKSQGMAMNQQVTFLSDGGDDVRQVQQYLNPEAEYWLDWFHLTMRITVMKQLAKGLAPKAKPSAGGTAELAAQLEAKSMEQELQSLK